MIRRHGLATVSTLLGVVAVILLALNEAHAAVYVTLAALALALLGTAFTAAHHRGH